MGASRAFPMPRDNERLVLLDGNGEIQCVVAGKRKNHFGKGWFAMFQDGLAWMGHQGLTGEQWSVFTYLAQHLDFDNYIRVKQKDIAEEFGIDKANVSKAMKRLEELGIIATGPMMGRSRSYRLNPYIGHKGKNLRQTVVDFDDLRKMRDGRNE